MPAEQRGSAYRTRTGWGVRWREHGTRRFRSGFRSKSQAFAYYRDEVAPRLGIGVAPDLTLADLVERFLAAHEGDPRTIRTLRERLKRPLDAFGDRRLSDLERSVADIAAWQSQLPGGYRPQIVAAFSQAMRQAVAWKLVGSNPVAAARTGKRRVAKRREIVPFTRDEVDRIAVELGPHVGPMIVFAAETGLRPAELAALEWRDVDCDQSVVHVRRVVAAGRVKEPKTERSRRRVPLTTRAGDALDSLPRRIDTRLVFPAPRGGHLDMHNLARRDWHPALDAAGLPPRRLYDLRHSFASNALAAGISLYELSRYMGASVRVLEMHYAHLVRDAENVARGKLDAAAVVRASSGRRVSGSDTENP
jgi:integrase